MEVSGPTAMWTRPDTGDSPVSYPVPTFSAAKGLFESVVRIETTDIVPTRVEICSPVIYHNYATNYGGPLRKSEVINNGGSYQLLATVLINVCYRLYAEVKQLQYSKTLSNKAQAQKNKGLHALHACQDIFNRRLKKGQWHDTPFLGWREFIPSYMGPFRSETRIEVNVNFSLPSFLFSVFTPEGKRQPLYTPNAQVKNGRLVYAK